MDVLVLIDKLDDLVHNAKPVPLTDQVRVDKEEIYDILDQMRATIPEEIKQARWIVKERQEMLAEAKKEAERIIKEARERQERLVGEEEVTKQAERAAEDIVEDARAREREIRLGAEDYADEILNTLEVNLSKFIAAVQRGRERLQGKDEPAEVRLAAAAWSWRACGPASVHAPPDAVGYDAHWPASNAWQLASGRVRESASALSGRQDAARHRHDRSRCARTRRCARSGAAAAGGRRRRPPTPARRSAIPTGRRSSTSAARSPSREVAPAHERARARAAGGRHRAKATAWRSCAATTAASSRRPSPARSWAPSALYLNTAFAGPQIADVIAPRGPGGADLRRGVRRSGRRGRRRGRKRFVAWQRARRRRVRGPADRGADRAEASDVRARRRRPRAGAS